MLFYYDWNASPNCLKTKILLYELGLKFEQRSVDRATLQGDEYRAQFPAAQAPAIEDGDVKIAESSAIALYLAEKHGALIPKQPSRRALMFQALSLEAALLAPTVGGQGLFGELMKPEALRNTERIVELRAKAQRVAEVLSAVLSERSYFADEFSIADIQLYAAIAKSIEGGVFENTQANLEAWHARMNERASVRKARGEYIHYHAPAHAA